jgi:hypothetical protein
MVRDVAPLKVARIGRVEKSDDPLRPFRLVDADGTEVAAVSEFLHHMLADDTSPPSPRSYTYHLAAAGARLTRDELRHAAAEPRSRWPFSNTLGFVHGEHIAKLQVPPLLGAQRSQPNVGDLPRAELLRILHPQSADVQFPLPAGGAVACGATTPATSCR